MPARRDLLILSLLLSALIITCLPVDSYCYGVEYEYYVYASGSDGIPLQGEARLTGQAAIYDSQSKYGDPDAGNHGYVNYYANIHNGTVGAWSEGVGGTSDNWPYEFSATGRTEKIGFFIDLYFTVSAGYYPDGLEVGVSGLIRCDHSSTIGAGTAFNYYVSFGGSSINLGSPSSTSIELSESRYVYTPFSLTRMIVLPEQTLGSPTQYTVSLTAQIFNNHAWSVLTQPEGPGSAAIDACNGIIFSSVDIPDGVTWTSESDIFLDQVPTGDDGPGPSASETRLEQNYPNPFNPVTTISYYLAEPAKVDLGIYDVSGRLVRTLERGSLVEAGNRKVSWNGLDDAGNKVASGLYFYRLEAGTFSETRKMVLLR